VRVSVVVPCRDGTPIERLRGLVAALAGQTAPAHEVLISVDGDAMPLDERALAGVRVLRGPRVGPGGARNRALGLVTGDLVVFLNDDVVPAPDLLERHAGAAEGREAMVVGLAEWAVREDDRVIDRVVRETSMVFFYDRMAGGSPDRDWGARHAWTLNLGVPRAICERFDERLRQPMFDDLEWARRIADRHGAPVLYRPGAVVVHHHWYTAVDLLLREVLLGHQIPTLDAVAPGFVEGMFGGELTRARLRSINESLPGRVDAGRRAFASFLEIAGEPGGDRSEEAIRQIADACGPWRDAARAWGFARASEGVAFRDAAAGLVGTISDLLGSAA
jgi:hypothetical protein